MRIIVVEDESKPREGLVRLLSRLDPSYSVVGQARNGVQGQEIVRALSPDVVITDVKMPEMDGLEMIHRLRSKGCASRFVILSGYAEFDYAKRGIQLGVRDYLLKPITPRAIGEVLKKIAEESPTPIGTAPPCHEAGALLLFHSPDGSTEAEKLILPLLTRSCERSGAKGCTLVEHPDPTSLLFHVATHAGFDRFIGALEREMEIEKTRVLRGGWICAACVFPEGGDPQSLGPGLRKDLKWSMLIKPLTVIHAGLIERTPCVASEYPASIESSVLSALRSGDLRALEGAVKDLRSFCISDRFSPGGLEEIVFRFFFTLTNFLKEFDYVRFKSIVEKKLLQRVEWFRSERELSRIMDDFVSCAAQEGSAGPSSTHSLPVRKAINYVRNGYRGRISLDEAAERIGLTPEYLSSLFLKETGRNFSAFVTECRIEEAKGLLAARGARVFEVGARVGLADPRYFCRVFKKHTGLSPSQYASLHS